MPLSTALPVVFSLVGVSGRIRGISRGKTPDERLTNGLIQCVAMDAAAKSNHLQKGTYLCLCRGEQVPCTVP